MIKKKIREEYRRIISTYKCQFCEEESPVKDWKDDKCPRCKKAYDPMLAQEGDD